jgi:hypothetical protein
MKQIEEQVSQSSGLEHQTLVERLRTRASIRRNIKDRKSVQEGKPDRIADLLEEAADRIERLESYWYTDKACELLEETGWVSDCVVHGDYVTQTDGSSIWKDDAYYSGTIFLSKPVPDGTKFKRK